MDTELISQIFEICIIPLLGYLVTRLIAFLNTKRDQAKTQTENEVARKYIDMITDTVTRCVIATNQTYVDTLKKQGQFNAEAQEIAFQKTLLSVSSILTLDAKNYIQEATGDVNTYLTQLIEAEVAKNKKRLDSSN